MSTYTDGLSAGLVSTRRQISGAQLTIAYSIAGTITAKKTTDNWEIISTESAPRLIQSISCDVRLFVCSFLYFSPPSATGTRRLLLREHITDIAKLKTIKKKSIIFWL